MVSKSTKTKLLIGQYNYVYNSPDIQVGLQHDLCNYLANQGYRV